MASYNRILSKDWLNPKPVIRRGFMIMIYNDLGDPDKDITLARPPLGGDDYPYPTRCRSGRPMSISRRTYIAESGTKDPFYVPIDEDFLEIKEITFGAKTLYSVLHSLVPSLDSIGTNKEEEFPLFRSIDLLYNEGVKVHGSHDGILSILPRLVKKVVDITYTLIRFETPETIDRDTFSWSRDEEFCRQMLVGLNPCSIELVTVCSAAGLVFGRIWSDKSIFWDLLFAVI
ncbi:linoleate 13S-lipoxygenase 2-1, chloroplastic-like protein [Tanacetum coccineum]